MQCTPREATSLPSALEVAASAPKPKHQRLHFLNPLHFRTTFCAWLRFICVGVRVTFLAWWGFHVDSLDFGLGTLLRSLRQCGDIRPYVGVEPFSAGVATPILHHPLYECVLKRSRPLL